MLSVSAGSRRVDYAGYRIGSSDVMTDQARISDLPCLVHDSGRPEQTSIALSASQVPGQKIVGWWSYSGTSDVPETHTTPAYIQYNDRQPVAGNTYSFDWTYDTVGYSPAYVVVDYDYIKYSLSYNANGGSGVLPSSENNIVYTNSVEISSNGLSRTGYTWSGWTNDLTAAVWLGGETITGGDLGVDWCTDGSNVVLYAKWRPHTYTINFYKNTWDDVSGEMLPMSLTYDVSTNLTSNAFVRVGYKFSGWAIEEDGPVIHKNSASVANLTSYDGDVFNLYAVWSPKKFSIKYHRNDGTDKTKTQGNQYFDAPTEILSESPRTGYAFCGWATSPDGGVEYEAGSKYPIDPADRDVVDLYAVWTPIEYTVKFDANGGEGKMDDATVKYDEAYAIPNCGFTKAGVEFQGWATNIAIGAEFYFGDSVSNLTTMADEIVTLYAVWSEPRYVAFNGNGANDASAMEEDGMTFEGVETKALNSNKFEKTGYTFAGWATNEVASVAYTNCEDIVSTNLWMEVGETNVLYAVWLPNSYTVVFNPNGGTGSMADQVFYYDQAQALSKCAFYSTLDFRGWATNQAGSVVFDDKATVSNLTAEANGILMLYAVWSNGDLSDAMHCTNIVWKPSGDGTDWRIAIGESEGYNPSGSSVSNMVFWTQDNDWLTSKKLTFKPTAHGTLSFWYKFSAGDQDNNERWLTINTDPESTLYGGTTWTNCTLSMGSDKNVEIVFEMDQYAEAQDYTVWIDQMTWVPDGSEEPEDPEAIKLSLQNAFVNGVEANETYASSEGGASVKRDHAAPLVSFTADPAPVDGVLFDSWELTLGEALYSMESNPLVLDGKATCFSKATESNCYVRAKYKWLEYSINYDANDGHGTVAPDASTYIYTNEVALASASPSAGYSFAGWTTNAAEGAVFDPGQVVTGADIGATTSGVVTLYANWTQNVYSVTFDANGGSFDGESAKSVTFNDVYGDLPTPSRAGHVFAGWTHDGGPVYSNTVVATASDHAIVAEWTANQYVVVFNANGGAGTMENQQFVYGEEQALSVVGFTAEERRFTGWSLTQDGAVAYGDRSVVSNLTEVAGGTVTLFASWESSGEGGEDDGPMLVGTGKVTVPKTWKTGQKVTWKATADKGSVFAHWEGPLVESLNLAANELRNPSLAFAVPEGFETNQVNAVFISVDEDGLSALAVTQTEFEPKEAVSNVWVTDDSQSYVTASASGLPAGLRFDAKTLRITGAPSKSGVYWVQIKAKNASGYQWAENFKVTVSGGGTEAKEPKLVRTAYHPLTVICATEGGTATGTGVYAEGKKASVKATAAKNYVFAGWYEDSELSVPAAFDVGDWRATSQNVIIPDMRYIYACFAEKSEDVQSLKVIVTNGVTEADGTYSQDLGASVESLSLPKLAVSGLPSGLKYDAKTLKISGKASKPGIYTVTVKATNSSVTKATEATTATFEITVPNFECAALPRLKPATDAYGTNSVGVAFDPALVDCTPTDGWTVKAAGLPAGLKWDTKSGTISGVPTAKTGAYTVTFTASKKGEENQTATITLNIEALPSWVVGTFDGSVDGGGLVQSFTVSANGKISGKVLKDGLVWTLSAPSFSDVEIPGSEAESPVFHASVIGKSGKLAFTNEVAVSAEAFGESMRGVAEGEEWSAWQNLWKTAPWKTIAKPFANKSLVLSGTADGLPDDGDSVMLKFAASGTVSASGKFVTGFNEKTKSDIVYSASCSSVLIPADEDHYTAFVYFPFKDGKFNGYAAKVQLVWTGTAFEMQE